MYPGLIIIAFKNVTFFCLQIVLSGLVVECLPGVREVMDTILGCVIPKTSQLVDSANMHSAWHQRLDQGNKVGLPIVECTCDWVGCYIKYLLYGSPEWQHRISSKKAPTRYD